MVFIILNAIIQLFNLYFKDLYQIQTPLFYHGLDTQAGTFVCPEM